ncbi:hypothetical protein K1719_008181 [Acacia pycnantha]|nr:hypothetical protein K1719_008181 [Acacia pycnantha]
MVDFWLSKTRNLHSLPQPLIVDIDVEWCPNFQRNMENPELKKSGIKTLARRVVDKEIEKPKGISRRRWDNLKRKKEKYTTKMKKGVVVGKEEM